MVTAMVAVCVTPPPLPVTVIVNVPALALRLAFTVTVALPFAAMDVGLRLTVTPLGALYAAVKAIVELNPLDGVEEMVEVFEAFGATVNEVGFDASLNVAGAEEVTVRLTVVVCVTPPPVPVIVIV